MAVQPRIDVWFIKQNKAVRGVPFLVVADWIQGGRLTADDKVQTKHDSPWQRVGDVDLLAAYIPRPVEHRAEDQAEALEPVELDFRFRKYADEEEDDPDMIPLIDISLVLLIFFMMTTGGMLAASFIETPAAENARVRAIKPRETITVSMELVRGNVRYFLGDEAAQPTTQEQLFADVRQMVRDGTAVDAIVKANPWIPYENVRDLLVGLERQGVKRIEAGVREKRPSEENP